MDPEDAGADPVGKTFFEIGAGRMVTIPTAYWLMGAEKTISVDLNPYLKEELVHEAVRYIAANREQVASLFGELLDEERFGRLLRFAGEQRFELRVFPIPKRGSRRIVLAYTETVPASQAERRYVYPLPRDPRGSTKIGRFTLDVQVRGHDPARGARACPRPRTGTRSICWTRSFRPSVST